MVRRACAVPLLVASLLLGCAGATASPSSSDLGGAGLLPHLDLQLRNSGLHGGYLWLGITGGAGRWHRFGQAELLCVTCPVPFGGAGPSYEIAVFDEACQLQAWDRALGGSLQVAIDLGPRVTLVEAPPVIDWMPADSPPIDPSEVPCALA